MYDLGVVFGWGGVINALKTPNANIASLYKKYESITNKTMTKDLENMTKN